jgi:hypothetical protein
VEKRLAHAYNILNNTHYRWERQYNFESFVTKLSEAFEILKDNDVAKSEREKVDFLLNGIQSDNQIIVTAKTTVRMNVAMRTSFQIAVDHLLELIGATFSNASFNSKQPAQNVLRMESGRGNCGGRGRGGRHGRGGRGGRGNRGGKFHNDVDITYLARTYTVEELRNLTPEVHQQMRDARAAKAKKAADANSKKRNVAAVNAEADIVVPEVMAKPDEDGPTSNRSRFGSGAYSSGKQVNCSARST